MSTIGITRSYAMRVGAQLEDLHEQRLLFEELEQLPQPGHVRGELMRVEQIPLAGYDIVLRRLRQGLAARLEGRGHEQRHILPELLQLVAQAAADVVEREAGVVLVEEIRRHGQLGRRVGLFGEQYSVLHVTVR